MQPLPARLEEIMPLRKNKQTIYGPDGRPLVRVNDRLAPRPKPGAGLEGWVSWRLIDRRGREMAGGEQHNLILNTFLDRLATTSATYGTYLSFASELSHFAVGTGSTPPSVTDTALDNEIARTTTQISSTTTRVADGVYELVVEREFDFGAGNGNLTEFGFASGAGGDMLVRELFRDGGGTPITLTKTSDYKLRIKYTHTLTLTPTFPNLSPHSFSIAGVGSISCAVGWIGGGTTGIGSILDLGAFSCAAAGKSFTGSAPYGAAGVASAVPSAYASAGPSVVAATQADAHTPSTYTPGTYERTSEAVFGADRGNLTIATIGVAGGNNGTGTGYLGLVCVVDANDRFTKDSLHALTLTDMFTVSWGRA